MYDFAIVREHRGYVPAYRSGSYCPGCGGGKWIVGRVSAECAGCGTALPLAPVEAAPAADIRYPAWANRP